ncbi:MAG: GNAT family N-acetyltransferase [Epsilonproteobacteria bacterium]|nr:GNAT family N-acetyltransferase [Campylobacterota bacterium]
MILKTERLLIDSIKTEDYDVLYQKIFSDTKVMKYALMGKVLTQKESQEFIEKYFSKNSISGFLVIREQSIGALVGFTGLLNYTEMENCMEFGFVLASDSWGKGYATEIGRAMISYAKEKYHDMDIIATVNPLNNSSINVLKKLDLEYIKTVNDKQRGKRAILQLKN